MTIYTIQTAAGMAREAARIEPDEVAELSRYRIQVAIDDIRHPLAANKPKFRTDRALSIAFEIEYYRLYGMYRAEWVRTLPMRPGTIGAFNIDLTF